MKHPRARGVPPSVASLIRPSHCLLHTTRIVLRPGSCIDGTELLLVLVQILISHSDLICNIEIAFTNSPTIMVSICHFQLSCFEIIMKYN